MRKVIAQQMNGGNQMVGVSDFLKNRLKGQITPTEAYQRICDYYGKKLPMTFIYEYEKVYATRRLPGQMLCVVKKTGKVMWEEELPDDLAPHGGGKMRPVWK